MYICYCLFHSYLIFRATFVASSHSPLSLVENQDFIDFVMSLNEKYKLPNRNLLREFIIVEGEKIKAKVSFLPTFLPFLTHLVKVEISSEFRYFFLYRFMEIKSTSMY
jgi:hypothetical protein